MKAMIFAAGLGTRLRPWTDNCPKALVKVGDKPLIQHVIERLIFAGFDDIIVNVHHFAPMITDFLRSKDNFGIKITVSDESDKLLDTGGGILKVSHLFGDEPILVHNVDILSDVNLRKMYDLHCASGNDATLLVSYRDTSRYLLFDDDYLMRGWTNIKTGEVLPPDLDVSDYDALAFGGIHVISPSLIVRLSEWATEDVFSIIPFYVASCASSKIYGYMPDEDYRWLDVGKPDSLAKAKEWFG